MDSIEEKILNIVKVNVNNKFIKETIGLSDTIESIGLSSIGFIQTIVAIESEFGFEFDEKHLDIKKFGTLQALVDFVKENSKSNQ